MACPPKFRRRRTQEGASEVFAWVEGGGRRVEIEPSLGNVRRFFCGLRKKKIKYDTLIYLMGN